MEIRAKMLVFNMHMPQLRKHALPRHFMAATLVVIHQLLACLQLTECHSDSSIQIRHLYCLDLKWPSPHSPSDAWQRVTDPSSDV